ncbi:FkbM family methyltransferase [Novipirellula sp. SH528]|uniref:FkbM family methyltransferase n=1 Tax=Novipirellula sp. SH528 TaxID=3454466 RepID=UPI003FA085A2
MLRKYLKPGMTVVDIGANVGYYSLASARLVGSSGRVIAVEPSPVANNKLASTIAENKISQIQLHCCGLADAPGQLELYEPNSDNWSPTMLAHGGKPSISVPVTTLDDLLTKCGVTQVDFLKIDVEGFEPKVLAGASQSLANRSIRKILIEFNDPWLTLAGSSAQQLWKTLIELGFRQVDNAPLPTDGSLTTRLFVLAD